VWEVANIIFLLVIFSIRTHQVSSDFSGNSLLQKKREALDTEARMCMFIHDEAEEAPAQAGLK
jgi:hypothetical protein